MTDRLKALRPTELIRALERAGFIKRRQTGSHLSMSKPGHPQSLVIPIHNRTLGRGLQMRIIKDAGLSSEQLEDLL